MKPFYTIPPLLLLALAGGIKAQDLPLGEMLNQDGTAVILEPFSPPPATLAPYLPVVPEALQDWGLMISVAPAETSATVLFTSVSLTTSDGKKHVCQATGAINREEVYSTVLVWTGKLTVKSVQGIKVIAGIPDTFGAIPSDGSQCD